MNVLEKEIVLKRLLEHTHERPDENTTSATAR